MMCWVLRTAVIALALAFAGPQSALSQDAIAIALEGWRVQERDGATYYRCASQVCAAGSVLSYKSQPHRPALTLAEFEDHHRGLAKHYAGTGNMRDVRVSEPKERSIDGARVLQVSRRVDWASGNTTFSIEARLIGKDRSYSVVSDSPKPEWTAANFEGFVRRMAEIASLAAPR